MSTACFIDTCRPDIPPPASANSHDKPRKVDTAPVPICHVQSYVRLPCPGSGAYGFSATGLPYQGIAMPSNTLVSDSHYTLRASKGAFSSVYGRRMAKETESLRSIVRGPPRRPRQNVPSHGSCTCYTQCRTRALGPSTPHRRCVPGNVLRARLLRAGSRTPQPANPTTDRDRPE